MLFQPRRRTSPLVLLRKPASAAHRLRRASYLFPLQVKQARGRRPAAYSLGYDDKTGRLKAAYPNCRDILARNRGEGLFLANSDEAAKKSRIHFGFQNELIDDVGASIKFPAAIDSPFS
jgi:hypothetical protein